MGRSRPSRRRARDPSAGSTGRAAARRVMATSLALHGTKRVEGSMARRRWAGQSRSRQARTAGTVSLSRSRLGPLGRVADVIPVRTARLARCVRHGRRLGGGGGGGRGSTQAEYYKACVGGFAQADYLVVSGETLTVTAGGGGGATSSCSGSGGSPNGRTGGSCRPGYSHGGGTCDISFVCTSRNSMGAVVGARGGGGSNTYYALYSGTRLPPRLGGLRRRRWQLQHQW